MWHGLPPKKPATSPSHPAASRVSHAVLCHMRESQLTLPHGLERWLACAAGHPVPFQTVPHGRCPLSRRSSQHVWHGLPPKKPATSPRHHGGKPCESRGALPHAGEPTHTSARLGTVVGMCRVATPSRSKPCHTGVVSYSSRSSVEDRTQPVRPSGRRTSAHRSRCCNSATSTPLGNGFASRGAEFSESAV